MKMRIWWVPQVPGKAFHFPVKTLEEAVNIYRVLGKYDLFLLENNHRVDYTNVGGLEVYNEEEGIWEEWVDVETGDTLDDYLRDACYDIENDEYE